MTSPAEYRRRLEAADDRRRRRRRLRLGRTWGRTVRLPGVPRPAVLTVERLPRQELYPRELGLGPCRMRARVTLPGALQTPEEWGLSPDDRWTSEWWDGRRMAVLPPLRVSPHYLHRSSGGGGRAPDYVAEVVDGGLAWESVHEDDTWADAGLAAREWCLGWLAPVLEALRAAQRVQREQRLAALPEPLQGAAATEAEAQSWEELRREDPSAARIQLVSEGL